MPVHHPGNVGPDIDLVIHSAAVPVENQEIAEARRCGIPVRKYADFLGQVVGQGRALAVAGTHGKTTTAGMLTSIYLAAGRDPSVLIGGPHPDLGGNWRHGRDTEFIVEACEYDRSFHYLRPWAGIITNLELDHPDIYRSEAELLQAFERFAAGFRRGGTLFVNGDSLLLSRIGALPGVRRLTFGFGEDCHWRASCPEGQALPSFEVFRGGRSWGHLSLRVPGRHSVLNALAALALAAEAGSQSLGPVSQPRALRFWTIELRDLANTIFVG